MRITQWLDELRADIAYALRQLRRAPAFTLVAIATLALGIGANGAMFALVDATLLRPLPFPDPDRLVMIWDTTSAERHGGMSSPDLRDILQQSDAFDALAGFAPGFGGSMVLSARDGTAQTLPRQWVSFGFFDVLGVNPIAGRTFAAGDETRRPSAVVVSEGLWRTTFGADPGLVGRDIRLDGEPFTVIGIVPAGTALVGPSALWAVRPLGMDRELPPAVRGQRNWEAIGRFQEHAVDDREHDGRGAAGQAERDQRNRRKSRMAAQSPQRMPRVVPEFLEPSRAARVAARLLHLLDTADLQPRPAARVTIGHAFTTQFVGATVDVVPELGVELALVAVAFRQSFPPAHGASPSG